LPPGPKRKLSRADSDRIAAMIEQGVQDAQIAHAFGVSRSTINRLRHFLMDNQPVAEAGSIDILRAIGEEYQRRIETHYKEYSHGCPPAETFDDGSFLCVHEAEIIAKRNEALEAFRAEFRPPS
jgi:Helix-turn-helix domain of resolvase